MEGRETIRRESFSLRSRTYFAVFGSSESPSELLECFLVLVEPRVSEFSDPP